MGGTVHTFLLWEGFPDLVPFCSLSVLHKRPRFNLVSCSMVLEWGLDKGSIPPALGAHQGRLGMLSLSKLDME
eukprot:150284-Amphidinium_carterae.1